MDLQTVFNAMTHAGNKIFELFSFKILMAAVLTLFLHKHFILFMGFILLVFVDCITKWVAISYEFLKEKGVENPSILACIKGTKTARKAGARTADFGTFFVQFCGRTSSADVESSILKSL